MYNETWDQVSNHFFQKLEHFLISKQYCYVTSVIVYWCGCWTIILYMEKQTRSDWNAEKLTDWINEQRREFRKINNYTCNQKQSDDIPEAHYDYGTQLNTSLICGVPPYAHPERIVYKKKTRLGLDRNLSVSSWRSI